MAARSTEEDRAALEAVASKIAEVVRPLLPPGVGFMTVVADFGVTGSLAYCANVPRNEMINLLAELREKLIEARQ